MVSFNQSLAHKLWLVSLLSSVSLAAPVENPRGVGVEEKVQTGDIGVAERSTPGNSSDNPIDATFNVTGWEDISELDCYAILCKQTGGLVQQRVSTSGERKKNYQNSGASLLPFHEDQLETRHTQQINPDTRSAEEFPWESIHHDTTIVFPATEDQQTSQGNRLKAGYQSANPKVNYGDFFRIRFEGNLGVYCTALFSDPPDTSVCGMKVTLFGEPDVDPGDFAYQVDKSSRPYVFNKA